MVNRVRAAPAITCGGRRDCLARRCTAGDNRSQGKTLSAAAQRQSEPSIVDSEVNDTQLVLLSARKSRGEEHWDKDDYDVGLDDRSGPVVGPKCAIRRPAVVLDGNRAGATAFGL